MRNRPISSRRHASGNVLLIAVLLLLLAGVMTVLAMNVGIFEQRSTANDVRAKAVHEVAEAAVAQGAEYLLRQHPEMFTTFTTFPNTATTGWTRCGSETTFPCGAIGVQEVDADGNPGGATVPRKSTMYRLTDRNVTITGLANELASRMLPMTDKIASVGTGFTVAYGVAPVMCFVANRHPNEAADSPIRCATSAAEASERRIVTFVAVAAMTGENARATVTQTVGRYPLLASPLGQPPIVASGSVDVTGTLQVVTNPNAGGTGVPVSVWSRKNVVKTGTANTCYADEFFRFGAPSAAGKAPSFATGTVKAILCDECSCPGDSSLSYAASGATQAEGIDILDVEGTSADRGTGINYNVRSDAASKALGICEFPPDLFAHVFGIRAWEDVTPLDCFAEKKVMQEFTNPTSGAVVTIGADEAFLYANAVKIINPTGAGDALVAPAQRHAGGYPSTSLAGLIWCQSNCTIGSNTTLGSADNPVVLVVDGSADIRGRVFGMVFLRTKAGGGTLTPAAGYSMTPAETLTGGNAVLSMNGGAAVYGSIVVQGQIDKANGTAAVIYSAEVLGAIGRNPNNNRFATLPGAWNDRSTY